MNLIDKYTKELMDYLDDFIERPVNSAPIFAPVSEDEFDEFIAGFNKLVKSKLTAMAKELIGSELFEKIVQLKMVSPDGNLR